MIYLNAGNLWTDEYLDKVIELNMNHDKTKVKSLFGSISKLTPTARSSDRIPYLEWGQIDKYVAKAKESSIAIRYTLNASCFGSIQDFKHLWDTRLKKDIEELHAIGVHEWTVTSPLLLGLLRVMFPTDFIEVSTIAEVSNAEEATRWMMLGADGVNISTGINRDFGEISRIGSILDVSILANEACLYKCPFRRECYNLSSHDSQRSEELFGFYPFRLCNEMRILNPVEWLKSRIVLPQWLPIYQEKSSVNWFKIAYRTHPIEVALPMLEAYMNMEYHGNLCDLWPTISKLGDTPEPRETTNIPCDKLKDFLVAWYKGDLCDKRICGTSCRYCDIAYERTQW